MATASGEDLWGWWPWAHHILHGNPWPGMSRCGAGWLKQELGGLGRLPVPLCTCLTSGEGTLPWSPVGMAHTRACTLDTHVIHEMGIITWSATSQELHTQETLFISALYKPECSVVLHKSSTSHWSFCAIFHKQKLRVGNFPSSAPLLG